MNFLKMLIPPGLPGGQVPGLGTLPTPLDNTFGVKSSMPFGLPGSSGGGPSGFTATFGHGMGGQMDRLNILAQLLRGR